LSHVEHTAENLQFCQWHDKYIRIFADLSESKKVNSPEWTGTSSAWFPKNKPTKRVAGLNKYPELDIKELLSEIEKEKPPGCKYNRIVSLKISTKKFKSLRNS